MTEEQFKLAIRAFYPHVEFVRTDVGVDTKSWGACYDETNGRVYSYLGDSTPRQETLLKMLKEEPK